MPRSLTAALLLLVAFAPVSLAGEAPAVDDAWVEGALAAAGPNRGELERVLAHFQDAERKSAAARFLIANMPGKGYITTELRNGEGTVIPFDPLAYDDFQQALAALEAIEAEHGAVEFARDKKIEDVRTMRADFLIRHIDLAFAAWEKVPPEQRVGFEAFLNHVLPYRGSEEPLDAWLEPLMQRYAGRLKAVRDGKLAPQALYAWLSKDVHGRVRFDERFYLHPTDQGFTEMGRSGLGRCEDITNMITFAARSMALATAADYTPFWAHRDNNHAWNVLLDKDGRGCDKAQSHAAKVYRKTFAIQRDSLPFHLPEGREAPNRFMASTTAMDVTDQYMETSSFRVRLDEARVGAARHAYLCVFNGGEWRAIDWSTIERREENGQTWAPFEKVGRGILYLVAVHDGERLVPVAPPLLVHDDDSLTSLRGGAEAAAVTAVAVSPKKVSPDTFVETPVTYLESGATYALKRWDTSAGEWADVRDFEAGERAPRFEDLAGDGLFWLVTKDGKSRRLERPWTITPAGFQRWW